MLLDYAKIDRRVAVQDPIAYPPATCATGARIPVNYYAALVLDEALSREVDREIDLIPRTINRRLRRSNMAFILSMIANSSSK
jgi:hypothetical protein